MLDLDTLLALEHRGWDSLTNGTGGTFYGELMTEDAVMILVNGMILDRDTIAASLNDAPPWDSYSITGARLIPVSPEAATLVYRATSQRGEDTFEAIMSSTYTLIDGSPALTLYQQTTISH
ncbi:nuclear transport factor 2 family protein [Corynebacterium aquatimens]|uniref:DUF4440 domain-containing protein n=1 Tax=Corynebacterium aquatimens TaxID=1190508 RepID=A0A931GWK3_9CORY|nr:nuclear transport factor 2 family protein [Corynebacterium aquatimens]MBG6122686.1 hypothetical protein [Corynebacterium aquatimens]WJY64783.1 hypothetical protein CAQUA_00140 [Corynebacterium aquatimens]